RAAWIRPMSSASELLWNASSVWPAAVARSRRRCSISASVSWPYRPGSRSPRRLRFGPFDRSRRAMGSWLEPVLAAVYTSSRFLAAIFPLMARVCLHSAGHSCAGLGEADAVGREVVDDGREILEVFGLELADVRVEHAAVRGREQREG